MNNKSEQTSQKLRGGYYTPEKMADFIVHWISGFDIDRILEPSAGDGVFIKSLAEQKFDAEITAVEFVEEEAQKIEKLNNATVLNQDFYKYYEEFTIKKNIGQENKFDAVIGNPPYIRYQFLSDSQREFQSDILQNNEIKPNKLINSWVAFTVASIEMLNEGGKIGFVLPTDLLQVSYAKQLREFLFNNLSKLTLITFDELAFEGIQQDVIILLGEKKSIQNQNIHQLKVLNLKNIEELKLNILNLPFETYSSYSADKWTKFYLSAEDRRFYENEFLNGVTSFNNFAKGEVGVTTGNNDYFVVDNRTLLKNDLSEYGIPTLGRSVEVRGVTYHKVDLQENIEEGKKIWMLDFNNKNIDSGELEYLSRGEREGVTEGYKIRIRNRWFDIPSIWKPDAFLLRRIGEFPRIVKNEIEATSTDTFHRIKVFETTNLSKLIFLMYSSITLLSFELEGRIFGGGALEILPGDLKNIVLPIVDDELDFETLFVQLDYKFREKQDINSITNWVNDKIKGHSAMSDKDIDATQKMLKKLRERRMKIKKEN